MSTGAASDSITFTNASLNGAKFVGGGGTDLFSGGISVGSNAVCFWGGAGADTFNFTGGISNSSGTAYFWNSDAGTDSINLSNAGAVKTGVGFGVTAGSGLVINFGDVSDAFGTAAATTSLYSVAGANPGGLATSAYSGATGVFLQYAGGATITLIGASGFTNEFASTFQGHSAAATTINFGSSNSGFPTFS